MLIFSLSLNHFLTTKLLVRQFVHFKDLEFLSLANESSFPTSSHAKKNHFLIASDLGLTNG